MINGCVKSTTDSYWETLIMSNSAILSVRKLEENAILPTYATIGSAGLDLYSIESAVLDGLEPTVVRTGIQLAISPGYVGMVCPRSGLAAKEGITVTNAPGIIDADYRGEIKVILHQVHGKFSIIKPGDRIAQLVIVPVCKAKVIGVDKLDDTERGEDGLGSTGK